MKAYFRLFWWKFQAYMRRIRVCFALIIISIFFLPFSSFSFASKIFDSLADILQDEAELNFVATNVYVVKKETKSS